MEDHVFTRRMLLQRGCMLASVLATVPSFIERSALAVAGESGVVGSRSGVPEDRILVVVQLGGGNDGLNTIIPYGDPTYHQLRPQLALDAPGSASGRRAGTALELSRDLGLGIHPSLTGFKQLFDEGLLGIAQGIGYPNPNRSHFTSMDIWQAGSTTNKTTGWLGRYFDCTCNGSPNADAAIALGRNAPLALYGAQQRPVCVDHPRQLDWAGGAYVRSMPADRDAAMAVVGARSGADDTQRSFLTRTMLDAKVASDRIVRAIGRSPLVAYPTDALASQLKTIGAMIRESLPTRVYYASLPGFDTHGHQLWGHANLLKSVGDAVLAFQRDLRAQGNDRRVLTLVFSEFGRRVRQNASAGTDHGTAAPVFLVGPNAAPGIHGAHPSLVDLDEGDLKFGTDFRSVYSSILEDWLRAPSAEVLNGSFPNARLVRTA